MHPMSSALSSGNLTVTPSTSVSPTPSCTFEKLATRKCAPKLRSPSTPRQRRKKAVRVTFSPTDEVQEIPHINDLSDSEVNDVWMTREELQAIRRQCATIVKFMDMDSAIRHGACLRGLEQNTPSYVAVQMEIRRQLYDTVFAIQHFQATTGVAVPKLLAETCQKFSRESVLQSQIVGINDAMFVQSTLDSLSSE